MDDSLRRKVKGVMILVDDDEEEHELLQMAFDDLGLKNELKCFGSAAQCYNYLRETNDDIFLVLCDINMPGMDGLEFKRMIELTPQIKIRSIPFFFHSNSASPPEVRAAYALGIQGYIKKAATVRDTQSTLERIMALWTDVIHPKDFR